MNTHTSAGDDLARHVDALNRKMATLSSQLESLLERASQGQSALPCRIPRKPENTKQMAPPFSDSLQPAPTTPFALATPTGILPISRATDTITVTLPVHCPTPSRDRPIGSQAPMRALSAPPTTIYPSAERIHRPMLREEQVAATRRMEEAQRRLEKGRRSRLTAAGLLASPPRPRIVQGPNPIARPGQRGRTAATGLPESLNAVVAGSTLAGATIGSATAPHDITQSPTRSRCTVSIPDSAMGHLIGRNGHGLRLATQLSGALISVAKPTTSSIGHRIVTIRGTTQQIGQSLVVMGKRIARQRVPNPRRRRPTHRDSVKPIDVVAPFEDAWETESVPVWMEESHDEPAAGATMPLSGEIPSGSEYLGEPMDICTANLEATIANPPSATATVAETRAYCEELEAQTRIVEAEVRLLKQSSAPTSLQVLPQPRGIADQEETIAMCTRLLDQVFTSKLSSQEPSSSPVKSPRVHKAPVLSAPTPTGHSQLQLVSPTRDPVPDQSRSRPVAGSAPAKLGVSTPTAVAPATKPQRRASPRSAAKCNRSPQLMHLNATVRKELVQSQKVPSPSRSVGEPVAAAPTKSTSDQTPIPSQPITVASKSAPPRSTRAQAVVSPTRPSAHALDSPSPTKLAKSATAAVNPPTASIAAPPSKAPSIPIATDRSQSRSIAPVMPRSTLSPTTSKDVVKSLDTAKAGHQAASKAHDAAAISEDAKHCPHGIHVRDSGGQEVYFNLRSPWQVDTLLSGYANAPKGAIARRVLAWQILRRSDAESQKLVDYWARAML